MIESVGIVSKYPAEILLVIVLVAIVAAFMTGTIVPGKYLTKRFEAMERQLDRVIDILLLKGSDD